MKDTTLDDLIKDYEYSIRYWEIRKEETVAAYYRGKRDEVKLIKQREHSSPTISDAVINSIESFVDKDGNIYEWYKVVNNDGANGKRTWVEYHLKRNDKIFRVSNGKESFTVGESQTVNFGVEKLIHSFKILNDKIIAVFGDESWMNLSSLRKVSKPILITTEDGVEITDGKQRLFGVWTEKNVLQSSTHGAESVSSVPELQNKFKWFSTEDAAKDYIQLHSKTLSISDVEKAAKEAKGIMSQLYSGCKYHEAIDTVVNALKSKQ